MANKTFDFSFMQDCADDLSECITMYMEDINPFVVQFEVEENEFPVEIQNEIRSIYGHICKAVYSENRDIAAENIKKIKSHSKRALLDCFKYSSITYTDMYKDFMKRYSNVDLTLIDKGNFLSDLDSIYRTTKEKLKSAKAMELKSAKDDKLFSAY